MAIKCIKEAHGDLWALYQGDCVEILKQLPSQSIGYSIYSPPFSNLFVYSDSIADMGNSHDDAEFFEHYNFMLKELMRVMKPGRLVSVHCSDLPYIKWKDGLSGLKDFSGALIRAHEAVGWILHCRTTIRKCPVVEMTRTKALGLLHKQLLKDSTKSRTGLPDYLLTFRTPGENLDPVGHDREHFPVDQWQEWAEGVWMDIQQGNTLNAAAGRDSKDERHICPLQLDLIERATIMWSNPGDVVLSPFAGIGSEGYVAVQKNRKFIGVELKGSYFSAATINLKNAAMKSRGLLSSDTPGLVE